MWALNTAAAAAAVPDPPELPPGELRWFLGFRSAKSSSLPAVPVGDALSTDSTHSPSPGQSSVPWDPLGFDGVCPPGLPVSEMWFRC